MVATDTLTTFTYFAFYILNHFPQNLVPHPKIYTLLAFSHRTLDS